MYPVDPDLTFRNNFSATPGDAMGRSIRPDEFPRPATYSEFLVSWFKTSLIIIGKVIIFAIIVAILAALILNPNSDDFDERFDVILVPIYILIIGIGFISGRDEERGLRRLMGPLPGSALATLVGTVVGTAASVLVRVLVNDPDSGVSTWLTSLSVLPIVAACQWVVLRRYFALAGLWVGFWLGFTIAFLLLGELFPDGFMARMLSVVELAGFVVASAYALWKIANGGAAAILTPNR